MKHNGTDYGVKFRYVWARPKHKDNMKFHIAKQYEGTIQPGSANLFGKTYFEGCSFYSSIWGNHQVEGYFKKATELSDFPGYHVRCAWCSDRIEEYEAKIYKHEEGLKKEKLDEEDIGVDDKECSTCGFTNLTRKTVEEEKPKKSKLDKSHMECVKCPLKYPMNNTTYLPEGSEMEVFNEFTGGGRQAHIYRCTCGHPLVIRIAGTVQIWSKVIIGRPIVVI